jgi:hypothetical protein
MNQKESKINPSPFRPGKALFWFLLLFFFIWIGVLSYLYLTTVGN